MRTRLLLLALLLLAPACGGSSDPRVLTDEGAKALNSGDFDGAAKSFQAALDFLGSDSTNSDWKRAKLGLIQAHIHGDSAKATDEFLTFAAASPSKLTDQDFNRIASAIVDDGVRLGDKAKLKDKLEQAEKVLTAGMKAYPESPHLKALLTDLGKRAEAAGASMDNLKGLGYVGGD